MPKTDRKNFSPRRALFILKAAGLSIEDFLVLYNRQTGLSAYVTDVSRWFYGLKAPQRVFPPAAIVLLKAIVCVMQIGRGRPADRRFMLQRPHFLDLEEARKTPRWFRE